MKSWAAYLITMVVLVAPGCRSGEETARTGAASTGEESAATEAPPSGTTTKPAAAPGSDDGANDTSNDMGSSAEEVTLPSGLKFQDLKIGDGTVAMSGMRASVHYTGWLTDGTKFDSSVDRGQPLSFVIGQGQVILGWEEGVQGMRTGGKRKLTIPSDLGYGARGYPGVIPANATLIFDVELLDVQ